MLVVESGAFEIRLNKLSIYHVNPWFHLWFGPTCFSKCRTFRSIRGKGFLELAFLGFSFVISRPLEVA
jgi:hypothetical protein